MIQIDLNKCTGCKRCETACAFSHSGKVNSHLARVKVLNLYESGIDGPIVCQQCRERYCMSCPVEALSLGPEGQIIVSPTLCTLCGVCEHQCPIGAIEIFNESVYVCDLCDGHPKCIKACTEGAISWSPETTEEVSLSEVRQKTRKMSPNQKRHWYLQHLGIELRKAWRKQHA